MQFWKKYKAKKRLRKAKEELKQKLEKARFINFYGNKIDLSLGEIIKATCFDDIITTVSLSYDEHDTIYCYIVLKYQLFFEKRLFIGENIRSVRDKYCIELNDFINSGKFTERLNKYNELEKEYELL
jgi:hypothetical protein